MQDETGLDPPEQELELALRSLAPAAARIDVVSAAFQAGRRSARRQVRLWQSAAAAVLLVSAGGWFVATGELGRNQPTPEQFALSAPALKPLSPQSAIAMQQALLEGGVSRLPPTILSNVGIVSKNGLL